MAVAKVTKLELIAHISDKEKILKSLEKAAIVQLKTREEALSPEEIKLKLHEKATLTQEQLSKVNFLLQLNKTFPLKKISAIDSFLPPKIQVDRKEFENTFQTFPLDELYNEMELLDVDLRHNEHALKESLNNQRLLEPWKKLDFNPQESETENTLIFLGTLPSNKENNFLVNLGKQCPLFDYQIIQKKEGLSYVALFIHKEETDKFSQISKQFEFSRVKLPAVKTTVTKTIADLDNRINKIKTHIKQIIKNIKKIGHHHKKLVVSKSFLLSEQVKIGAENNLIHTENVFVLEGWVKQSDTERFKKIVNNVTDSFVIRFLEAGKDEKPPIILQNPRWLKPFEAVTALYGMPSYQELDPTPYMAPFFLIFFGLAVGDVVYGLALALICWGLKKSARFSENTKTFLTLFIYGGISAAFFGAITGSWLTFDPAILPTFLKKLIVFNPLGQPALFLVITLLLGLSQLYFGLILKMVDIYKEKSLSKALQSQVPPLLMLPGVALLIAKLLGFPLSDLVNRLAVYLTIGGSLGIVVFSETEAKNIFSRLGIGLYNLYGMSSFLGDTISYGRIMALGLATFLIGSAINTILIGGVIFKSLLIKILLGIFVLPLVHLVNLAINTIGAFVHPARLQYVEFFGKFFEGSGRRFNPLKAKTDNIIIE